MLMFDRLNLYNIAGFLKNLIFLSQVMFSQNGQYSSAGFRVIWFRPSRWNIIRIPQPIYVEKR